MASSLVFCCHVFSSRAGHMGFQRLPEGSIPRSTNVRFRRCFKVRATQVSSCAGAISDAGHMEGQNLYEVLGVGPGVTAKDIRRAYRKLAKTFHPDHAASHEEKKQNTQMFVRIHNAYVTLSDPHDRTQYDRQLAGRVRGFARQTWSKATEPSCRDWRGRVGRNWETDQCWWRVTRVYHAHTCAIWLPILPYIFPDCIYVRYLKQRVRMYIHKYVLMQYDYVFFHIFSQIVYTFVMRKKWIYIHTYIEMFNLFGGLVCHIHYHLQSCGHRSIFDENREWVHEAEVS